MGSGCFAYLYAKQQTVESLFKAHKKNQQNYLH